MSHNSNCTKQILLRTRYAGILPSRSEERRPVQLLGPNSRSGSSLAVAGVSSFAAAITRSGSVARTSCGRSSSRKLLRPAYQNASPDLSSASPIILRISAISYEDDDLPDRGRKAEGSRPGHAGLQRSFRFRFRLFGCTLRLVALEPAILATSAPGRKSPLFRIAVFASVSAGLLPRSLRQGEL